MIHVVHVPRQEDGNFIPSCIPALLLKDDNPFSTVHLILNTADSRLAAEWVSKFSASNDISFDVIALTRAEARRGDFPGLQHFPFPLHSVQAYFLPEVSVRQEMLDLEQPF